VSGSWDGARTPASGRAPVYVDSYDLAAWLLGHLDVQASTLARDTCRLALVLLDQIVLALKNRDRWERLEQADETIIRLRQRIRLAHDAGFFDDRQALHALGRCDSVGRQIGGWQRSLEGSQ